MAPSRVTAVGALALAAAVTVFWAIWHSSRGDLALLGNSDLLLYFYPLYEVTYGWLASGVLPLWNPYQLCGLPWLATLQGGFFYPPHLLYLFLPTHLALAALTLLHFVFVALTTALFARRAGLGPAAAALAALVFCLRGTIPNATLFPSALEAAAWLPTGCLAVLALTRGAGLRAALVLALATGASFLAGYPQTTVFLVYTWGSLLVVLLVARRTPPRAALACAGLFVLALALGGALAGIQLLPATELSRAGTRATQGLPPSIMFPIGPVLGNPVLHTFRGPWLMGIQYAYGLIPLALLPVVLLTRRHVTLTVWALAFGLLTLAFALGPLTPLWTFFMTLPMLGWFRLPSRIILITDFCLALLAGIALEVLTRSAAENGTGRRIRTIATAALPILSAALLVTYGPRQGTYRPALLVVGAAVVLIGTRRRPQLRAAGLVLLVAAELFLGSSPAFLRPYTATTARIYRAHEPLFQDLATRLGHDRIWLHVQSFLPDLNPKLPSRYRLRAIGDYEPVNLRRQADFFTYVMAGTTESVWPFDGYIRSLAVRRNEPPPATRRRLLDLAAMRFMVTPRRLLLSPELPAFVRGAGLEPHPSSTRAVAVFENPHVLPRAFVTYRTQPAPARAELLARLSEPDFDPLVESYVEGEPGLAPAPDAPARGGAATFLRDDAHVVELEATLAAPGLLVLADAFFPGWSATVDGAPAPILATNHLFRGVPVPAGQHRIRFAYRPWTFPAGVAVSLAAAVALGGLWLVARRRPRQPAAGVASAATLSPTGSLSPRRSASDSRR
jgi:hypothetical protein